jgi:hypothetical protein
MCRAVTLPVRRLTAISATTAACEPANPPIAIPRPPVRQPRDSHEGVAPLVVAVVHLLRRDVRDPELVRVDTGRVRELVDELL